MKNHRLLFCFPRILTILFLCFLALFSLDVFSMEGTILEKIGGLFIHNIPTLILLGVLIVAWKFELFGAVVFLLAALFYIGMALRNAPNIFMALSWSTVIAGPAILISIFFFLNWVKKKKENKPKGVIYPKKC